MHHFFIDPLYLQTAKVIFPEELCHQIARVLRLRAGDHIVLLDNAGNEFTVNLISVGEKFTHGEIIAQAQAGSDARFNLHLFIALTQRDKFEWILQKVCEIGVAEITPMITSRSLQQHQVDFLKKRGRWEKILREAAEQSRRGMIPILHEPVNILDCVTSYNPGLIAWEDETNNSLKTIPLPDMIKSLNLLIGPKGGFSKEEIHLAQSKGWQTFSLGKRILRVETAAIVACALLLHHYGDI